MKAGLRMTSMIAREAIIPIMGSMLISGSGCELPSGSVGGASISRGFRLALTFFGLSVFDDERTGVEEVARTDVLGSVAGAHRSLVIATLAVAVATCVAGVVLTANFSLWTAGISAVLAVVVAGRSRLSPLIAQKATLTAAGLVVREFPVLLGRRRDLGCLACSRDRRRRRRDPLFRVVGRAPSCLRGGSEERIIAVRPVPDAPWRRALVRVTRGRVNLQNP